ncbi:MAG TPA: Crp/Fnr family transcriptional regulator [Burkholderiales bacterium]|nr:Crp/Fnr family transcriptional regulator [Burkholderiales bacterium]
MIAQFQAKEGRPMLMDALRRQFLVDGNSAIAERIASDMLLKEFNEGEMLFNQGERGSEIYLILAGKVSIRIDGEQVAVVDAGMHVGEVGMLEPFKGRSAAVVAIGTVVAAVVTQRRFFEMSKAHPELWQRLALELAHRLVSAQRKG